MAFWNDPSALTPKQSHRWVISFGNHNFDNQNIFDVNQISAYFAKSVDKPSYEIGMQQAKYLYSHNFNFPKRLIWKPITITFYDVIMEKINSNFLFAPTVNSLGNKEQSLVYSNGNNPNLGITTRQEDRGTTIATVQTNEKVKQSTQLFFYKFLQDSGYFDPEEYGQQDQLLRFRKYNFKKNMIRSFVGSQADYIDSQSKQIYNTDYWQTLNITELDQDGLPTETWKIYGPLISDVKFDKLDYTNENVITVTATIHYDWAKLVPRSQSSSQNRLQNQQLTSDKEQPPKIGAAERLARISANDKTNKESLIGSSGRNAIDFNSGFGNRKEENIKSEIVGYSMMGRTVGRTEPLSPDVFSPSKFEGGLNNTTGTTSPEDIKKLTDQLKKDLESIK